MKKIAGTLLIMALALTGCASENKQQDEGSSTQSEVSVSTAADEKEDENKDGRVQASGLTKEMLDQVYVNGIKLELGITLQELLDNFDVAIDEEWSILGEGGGSIVAKNIEKNYIVYGQCVLGEAEAGESETGEEDPGAYILNQIIFCTIDSSIFTFGDEQMPMTYENVKSLLGQSGDVAKDQDGKEYYAQWSAAGTDEEYFALGMPTNGDFKNGVVVTNQ